MAKRVFLAAVLSAVLMFVWSFVFWAFSGALDKTHAPLPAELDVLASLRNSQAPSGMYLYPPPCDSSSPEAMAEWKAKHEEGPLLRLAYVAEGGPPMPPIKYLQGLGHYFAVALLSGSLVVLAGSGLPSFGRRFGFVVLLSLIASVWTNVGDLLWWRHSVAYCLGNMAYELVAGVLMGLVIAAIVKRGGSRVEG